MYEPGTGPVTAANVPVMTVKSEPPVAFCEPLDIVTVAGMVLTPLAIETVAEPVLLAAAKERL